GGRKEDYHRYLAEFKRGVEKEEAVGNSLKSYQKATSLAEAELGPTDPVRLGLALNFSVFYYQILHSPQRACDIARQAFDSAISELHTLDYESFKGSTSLMRLLNENLSLWSPDLPEDHGRAEKKASLKQKRHKKSSRNRGDRLQRSVGMGFRTPKEAIEGNYIDKKCPFTGTVSIRGRIISGICHSAKMTRTVIVRRNYLHYVSKYRRYEKRHSNIPAHVSPCFHVKEGDRLVIGQCRPLSKTVSFNVLKVIPAGSSWKGKKAFTGI
ncbi:40S ribosomal protein S11-2, partial [Linum grandiflorum]